MSTLTQPLAAELRHLTAAWGHSQRDIVLLAADFADSNEWALDGSPTAAHWLAAVADIETCTAREWIRISKQLRTLHASADAFTNGTLSYAKIRTLTRIATPTNETELIAIAKSTPASQLACELAKWLNKTSTPEELEHHQKQKRSVKWRNEPDGMTVFTLRLPPLLAGTFIAALTTRAMTTRPLRDSVTGQYPTLTQQHADSLEQLLTDGSGTINTEIVLHVRGDGCTLDDGTPIPDTVIERIASDSFLRALIHDAETNPVNASHRQRHPTARQKRVVKERDQHCVDCGRKELLQYDHQPAYAETQHTITEELKLRCAPCHHKRHENGV